MNKLTIKYHGNQIQKAADDYRSVNYYSLRYPDAVNRDVEYFYDSNGNLVKNLDNMIQRIKYNIINLPEVVAFSEEICLPFIIWPMDVKCVMHMDLTRQEHLPHWMTL